MPIKTAPVVLPANSPVRPPRRYQELAWALKGINTGEADRGQQTLALSWIIRELCGTYDLPYRPDSERDSAFAAGKMHVGQQIVALINMTPEQITRLPRLGASTQEDDDSIRDM
jgi:hypothetical protein